MSSVDQFIQDTSASVVRTVSQVAKSAKMVLQDLAMPYHPSGVPVIHGLAAAGRVTVRPGVRIAQDMEQEERVLFAQGRNKNRDAFFSRIASSGPQKKGEMSYTTSNCCEDSGSKSLTGSSDFTFWADDFSHEGL
jgi:hypothetical protein